MIGRLVKQQHFRLRRHHPRQRGAALLAARQAGQGAVRVKMQISHDLKSALLVLIIEHIVQHISANGFKFAEIGVLRQIGNGNARLGKPLATIGLGQPGNDFQQSRFARPVAPDKANTLAAPD